MLGTVPFCDSSTVVTVAVVLAAETDWLFEGLPNIGVFGLGLAELSASVTFELSLSTLLPEVVGCSR